MKPGEVGILLAVAGIGLLMYSHKESAIIGATEVIKAGQFTYRREIPSPSGSKPTPASRSRSSGGGVGGPDTKAKYDKAYREQAQRNYWKRVSQIPPAIRKKIVQTWINRARKIALVRLAAILNARRRQSGYQTVGYTGGFGGTIAPTVPGVTGAVGANTYSAYEEALGLKPSGQSKTAIASKAMENTANGAIQDFINCKGNTACKKRAADKFDQIIMSKSTAVANSLYQLKGQFDPTQSLV